MPNNLHNICLFPKKPLLSRPWVLFFNNNLGGDLDGSSHQKRDGIF